MRADWADPCPFLRDPAAVEEVFMGEGIVEDAPAIVEIPQQSRAQLNDPLHTLERLQALIGLFVSHAHYLHL